MVVIHKVRTLMKFVIQWDVKTCWERVAVLTGKQTAIHETKRFMLVVVMHWIVGMT